MLNFNSGPAALPREVIREAAAAVVDFKDGLSILEIPHRGADFRAVLEESEQLVLDLLGLDHEYRVLWLQGGGRLQFCMLPLNFLNNQAGYIETGHWAQEARKAAAFYGHTDVLGSSADSNFDRIPAFELPAAGFDYLHITTNNTIYGTQFQEIPECGTIPLVADMSSELFSRCLDYRKFDLIYAVAQKNIGPAGVTLVVIKKSLLERQVRELPDILSYKAMARNHSMVNTPPVFAIYCSLLNLRWIAARGISGLEAANRQKAGLLYETIDQSKLFYGTADKPSRSMMNVCFRMQAKELEPAFLTFALKRGITGIEGHRSVGGFRAALYNAISLEDVAALAAAITDFEADQKI